MPREDPSSRSKPRASRLVLLGRVLLLACAVSAAIAGSVLASRHDRRSNSLERYLCPMHPEVVSNAPGDCPICHMALELAPNGGADASRGGATDAGASDETLPLSEGAKALLRKSVGLVRRHVLAQPLRLSAWCERPNVVVALVPDDDAAALERGMRGTFHPASEPTAGIDVTRTSDAPERWDGALGRVTFEPLAGARACGSGAIGWVVLTPPARTVLVVPDSAIIQGSRGPYVLSVSADGRSLARRSVETGRVFSGLAVVTAGLTDHELVLVKNTFFLDAERRLRAPRGVTVAP